MAVYDLFYCYYSRYQNIKRHTGKCRIVKLFYCAQKLSKIKIREAILILSLCYTGWSRVIKNFKAWTIFFHLGEILIKSIRRFIKVLTFRLNHVFTDRFSAIWTFFRQIRQWFTPLGLNYTHSITLYIYNILVYNIGTLNRFLKCLRE